MRAGPSACAKDADEWARATESRIDRGREPLARGRTDPVTFSDLVYLHVADMAEVGKAPRRTKSFSLDLLEDRLGKTRITELTRERLIAFGKARAREGAGPVTLAVDFAYIRTIVAHAAAVHGMAVSPEPITLARIALKRLGLVGPGRERDRRPTEEEIEALLDHLDTPPRCLIPTGRIVRFAIATGLRQEE